MKLYKILCKKQRRWYEIKTAVHAGKKTTRFPPLVYTMGIFTPAVKAEPPQVQNLHGVHNLLLRMTATQ